MNSSLCPRNVLSNQVNRLANFVSLSYTMARISEFCPKMIRIGQICRRIVVKNCQWRGVGVKNCENLTTSLMDGPQIPFKNFSATFTSNGSLLSDKQNFFILKVFWLMYILNQVSEKCQFLTFKVNFLCQKLSESFQIFFIEEYHFRGMFFVIDIF